MVFFISYKPVLRTDINTPLQEKLRTYKDVLLLSNNMFLLTTEDDTDSLSKVKQIRDDLEPVCGRTGCLFIGEMGEHAAWYGYNGEKIINWLSKYINSNKNTGNVFDPNQNGVDTTTQLGITQQLPGNKISAERLKRLNINKTESQENNIVPQPVPQTEKGPSIAQQDSDKTQMPPAAVPASEPNGKRE